MVSLSVNFPFGLHLPQLMQCWMELDTKTRRFHADSAAGLPWLCAASLELEAQHNLQAVAVQLATPRRHAFQLVVSYIYSLG